MQSDAGSSESIRKAARRSLHDGFTACLFVGRKGDPAEGEACATTSRCGPGELCNEHGVCAAPVQPYNFRLLGEGLRVLEPRWREHLDAATNDLQVRAMELDLEDVAKHEVPAAAEMVRRSRYFTAVLDEVPEGGIPAAPTDDGGPLAERIEQRLQAADHFVRVGIWDVPQGQQLVQVRVSAAGRFLTMGRRGARTGKIARAQQRQANSCAAASEVRERLLGRGAAPGMEGAEEPARQEARADSSGELAEP
jgi:hypothetical protein